MEDQIIRGSTTTSIDAAFELDGYVDDYVVSVSNDDGWSGLSYIFGKLADAKKFAKSKSTEQSALVGVFESQHTKWYGRRDHNPLLVYLNGCLYEARLIRRAFK